MVDQQRHRKIMREMEESEGTKRREVGAKGL